MRHLMRRARVVLAVLMGTVLISGCDFSVYEIPLPGGTDVGDDPVEVQVEFRDVLDLVPQSAVKVNDVTVGKVTEVDLEGDHAVVTLELPGDVDLPADTRAKIRQTSLLGEKFVSLEPPPDGGQGALADQATITLDQTGRNPEVEEVLGALSLVLNGGGVAQLKTITHELNLALEGREDSARSVLTQVSDLMGQLDRRKGDIVNAIEALNRLALSVREHQPSIDAALEELPSALDSITRQRKDLVRMLKGLNRLGDVGVRVIRQTKESTVSMLKLLDPVLTQVGDAGDDFVNAAHVFFTFPFVDEVVGRDPQVARNIHHGDYVNLSIELDLNLSQLTIPDVLCIPFNELPDNKALDELLDLKNLCAGVTKAIQSCLKTPPDVQACQKLPQYLLDEVCDAVNIPVLCGLLSPNNGGNNNGGNNNASGNPIQDLLDGVLGGLGLPRPAPGDGTETSEGPDDPFASDLAVALAGPVLMPQGGRSR